MDEPSKGPISPSIRHYIVQGRAAEIARSFGYRTCGPEHLFLAMLHDGGYPVTAIADLVDFEQAEAAVLALFGDPDYTPPPPPRFPQRDGFLHSWGAAIAFELDDDYLGLEHELLSILRYRDSVPARALAAQADLDALESAVLAAKNAPRPPQPPADAVILPDGFELDRPLRRALGDIVSPEEITWGRGTLDDGRPWIHVFGPDEATDDALTRQVLNRALATVGRPPLEGGEPAL
jgi:hypothetical protein